MDSEFAKVVSAEVTKVVRERIPFPMAFGLAQSDIDATVQRACEQGLADLHAYAERDPAAYRNAEFVAHTYNGFYAVLYHRIAHSLWTYGAERRQTPASNPTVDPLYAQVRAISEHAKALTGIEIHPSAQIGVPFVVDHGAGTVIGETTRIGRFCYLLQAVVLGARHVADGGGGQRHPTIGDRVEIAGNSQVIGPVTVGDDVIIDPGAKVTFNVPAGTHVRVLSTVQLCDGPSETMFFGVLPVTEGRFRLVGRGLQGCCLSIELADARSIDLDATAGRDDALETLSFSVDPEVLPHLPDAVLIVTQPDGRAARIGRPAAFRWAAYAMT
jgi:serine acetyltransferase